MKTNKILLDDVEKIYFSIPCTSVVSCEHCKNKLLCDLTAYLLKIIKEIILRGGKMKINLNDILVNSYDRNMKQLIVIYDDNGDFYTFTESNILERVKQMKVERFDIVSEKLIVIKVVGVINE